MVSTLIKSVADFRGRHKLVCSSSTLVTPVIAKSEIATPSARNDNKEVARNDTGDIFHSGG